MSGTAVLLGLRKHTGKGGAGTDAPGTCHVCKSTRLQRWGIPFLDIYFNLLNIYITYIYIHVYQSDSTALRKVKNALCSQICKLDCHALLSSLRAIEKGSTKWRRRREDKLKLMAPVMMQPRFKTYREKLIGYANTTTG